MGSWSIFDFIANVCRSVSDVLHIGIYLLLVIIAILYAADRSGSKTYLKHIYVPFMMFLVKKNMAKIVKVREHGRRIPRAFQLTIWTSTSNRLPYYVKIIKDFFKGKFF